MKQTVKFLSMVSVLFLICLLFEYIFTLKKIGDGRYFSLGNVGLLTFKEFFTSIALLFGMIARYVFDYLSSLEAKGQSLRISQTLTKIVSDPGFYKSLLVAPIVYYSVFFADSKIDPLIASPGLLLYAFENGFFWNTLLAKASHKLE